MNTDALLLAASIPLITLISIARKVTKNAGLRFVAEGKYGSVFRCDNSWLNSLAERTEDDCIPKVIKVAKYTTSADNVSIRKVGSARTVRAAIEAAAARLNVYACPGTVRMNQYAGQLLFGIYSRSASFSWRKPSPLQDSAASQRDATHGPTRVDLEGIDTHSIALSGGPGFAIEIKPKSGTWWSPESSHVPAFRADGSEITAGPHARLVSFYRAQYKWKAMKKGTIGRKSMHEPVQFFMAAYSGSPESAHETLPASRNSACGAQPYRESSALEDKPGIEPRANKFAYLVLRLLACPQNNVRVFVSPSVAASSLGGRANHGEWRQTTGLFGALRQTITSLNKRLNCIACMLRDLWYPVTYTGLQCALSGEMLGKKHTTEQAFSQLQLALASNGVIPTACASILDRSVDRSAIRFAADPQYGCDDAHDPPASEEAGGIREDSVPPAARLLARATGMVLSDNSDAIRTLHGVQCRSAAQAGKPAYDAFVRLLRAAESKVDEADNAKDDPRAGLQLSSLADAPEVLAKRVSDAVHYLQQNRSYDSFGRGRAEHSLGSAEVAACIGNTTKHRDLKTLLELSELIRKSNSGSKATNLTQIDPEKLSGTDADVHAVRMYCEFKTAGDASIIIGFRPARYSPRAGHTDVSVGARNGILHGTAPVAALGGVRAGFIPTPTGERALSAPQGYQRLGGESAPPCDYADGYAYTIGLVDLELKQWHRVPYWWAMEQQVAAVHVGAGPLAS